VAGLPPRAAGLPGDIPAPRRLGNALEWALRLASPRCPPGGAQGRHRRRCALPVPLIPVTPNPPCEGALPLAARTRRAPGQARSPVARYIARFSQVDIRTAWRAAVLADRGRRPCACRGTGDARSCRTRRGLADSVGAPCPHPPRRSLRSAVGRTVFDCRAVCGRAPVAGAGSFPSPPAVAAGTMTVAGPWQPHAAAGCGGVFLPPQAAQCNPRGATSRAGLAPLGAHAHPGHGLIHQDWGRAGRRKKNHKCRSNRPRRGQGPYSMFSSPPPRQDLAVRGEHRYP